MVYLDYSATTPVNEDVLNSFNTISKEFIGNANSSHGLGIKCQELIDESAEQVKRLLDIKDSEIIWTSGSSEANNLAIKGVALKYASRGKHIITSSFEHSSVYGPLEYLRSIGYEISYVKHDSSGKIDLNNLKELIRDDTILVSINAVNSELGIVEPIDEIGVLLKEYPKCIYHVDITQAVGKIHVNLDNIDLASFSAHKIYGIKGVGALIKKNKVLLEPLIHGGKSTTIYRSGTPFHPLVASLAKALRIATSDLDDKYIYIKDLNKYLKNHLKEYKDVYINSPEDAIPHILNISIKGVKSETFMRALSNYEIYVSTKSACSDEESISESVYALTNDKELARSSIRISLSSLTTKDELNEFLEKFNIVYNKLKN